VRCVNNGPIGNGVNGYYNQDNLISLMSKEAAKKQNQTATSGIESMFAAESNLSTDKGVYDSKTGTWASSGNLSLALRNLEERDAFNQIINNALTKAGIKLSSKEKMTLTIDKDGQISVSGIDDQAKKTKIEETLNNALKDVSVELMMHIESVKAMNGKENTKVLDKWMVYNFLKEEAGQDLNELKLVNGEIVGANEALEKIIDGKADFGDKNEYVKEVIIKLKSILTTGAEKISDLEQKIDFQNGSLIDIDSNIGFGPDQLKTWFDSFRSGRGRWNAKA